MDFLKEQEARTQIASQAYENIQMDFGYPDMESIDQKHARIIDGDFFEDIMAPQSTAITLGEPLPAESYLKANTGEQSSDNQMYDVEKIVDKRETPQNGVEYLIKWKGYNDSENEWKPIVELVFITDLIEEFEAEQKKTKAVAKQSAKKKGPITRHQSKAKDTQPSVKSVSNFKKIEGA